MDKIKCQILVSRTAPDTKMLLRREGQVAGDLLFGLEFVELNSPNTSYALFGEC